MALVNGGFLHYTDMKKFLKNLLLRNCLSDSEIFLQESGFDISGRPDCPIRAVIATGKLARRASKTFGAILSILVFITDTVIFEIW